MRSDGNVGIGTASPSQKLDIRYPTGGGMALIKDSDSNDGLLFGDMAYSTGDTYQGIKHVGMTGSSDYMLISEGTNTLMSAKGTAGKVYIRGGGNYGSNQILVYGSSGYTENAAIELDAVAGREIVVNQQQRNVDFRVESNTDEYLLFTVASTDRIGIGTASPATKLQISDEVITDTTLLSLQGTSWGGGEIARLDFTRGTNAVASIAAELNLATTAADLIFDTASTERLRIGSAGAITFNDQFTFPTTDGSGNYGLVTDGSGNVDWQPVLIDTDLNTSIESENLIALTYNSSSGTLIIGIDASGVSSGKVITSDGDGTVSWQDQSGSISSAVAWGSYNAGASNARGEEYNVSSITDNGSVGTHTVNLSITMGGTDYCVIANEYHHYNWTFGTSASIASPSTTSFTILTGGINGTTNNQYDSTYVAYAVFGSTS
jgi:hypothetical protein